MSRKIVSLFALIFTLCAFLMIGCSCESSENTFDDIASGSKIEITPYNYSTYTMPEYTYSEHVREDELFNGLTINCSIKGYEVLSYFNVTITLKVTCLLLIESGEYEESVFYINCFLNHLGDCSVSETFSFGTPVRSIKDVKVAPEQTSGFVVKK